MGLQFRTLGERPGPRSLFYGFRLQDANYQPIEVQAGQGRPSAVLGARWVLGGEQRTLKNETFTLMRLCRPGTMTWYPTIAEKNAASARKDEALMEKGKALAEKDEALAEQAALLAQYGQRCGSLEADGATSTGPEPPRQ